MAEAAASGWRSLRELDAAAGTAKGTAFRAFKRLQPQFAEGADFTVAGDPANVAELVASRRLYPAAQRAIMLSPRMAAAVLEALRQAAPR